MVYTPGEIVRFMIRSTDWLCEKHFGKNLVDRGVEILDPATGTGTFIVELLEHFRGHHDKLRHKYREVSCPLLSGPSTMTVWIKEGTTNACQEAQARGDHREAA